MNKISHNMFDHFENYIESTEEIFDILFVAKGRKKDELDKALTKFSELIINKEFPHDFKKRYDLFKTECLKYFVDKGKNELEANNLKNQLEIAKHEYEASLNQSKVEISTLQTKIIEYQKELNELLGENKLLKDKVSNIENDIKKLLDQIKNFDDLIKAKDKEIEVNKYTISITEKQIAILKKHRDLEIIKKESIEAGNEKIRSEAEIAKKEIERVKEEANEAKNDADKAKEEANRAKLYIFDLQKLVEDKEKLILEYSTFKGRTEELTKRNTYLLKENKKIKGELEDLRGPFPDKNTDSVSDKFNPIENKKDSSLFVNVIIALGDLAFCEDILKEYISEYLGKTISVQTSEISKNESKMLNLFVCINLVGIIDWFYVKLIQDLTDTYKNKVIIIYLNHEKYANKPPKKLADYESVEIPYKDNTEYDGKSVVGKREITDLDPFIMYLVKLEKKQKI